MELQGMLIHDLDLAWLLKPADLHNHKLPVAIKHICILELIFSAWGFQLWPWEVRADAYKCLLLSWDKNKNKINMPNKWNVKTPIL